MAEKNDPLSPPRAHDASNGDTTEEATPSPRKVDPDQISEEVRRLFDLVPEIGTKWRWYDLPYRALRWLLSAWRRKVLPWRLRHLLNRALNFFSIFNHYERLKAEPLDHPLKNLIVPPDEKVTQGGIWVVEFFPPSHYADLIAALEKNGWDERSHHRAIDGSNAERVTNARRGKGFGYYPVGSVARPNYKFVAFEAKRENLPSEIDLVHLTAVQLGSVTAVVARMSLSEAGRDSLNTVWTASHEPTIQWHGLHRPQTEGRYFAAILATQRERQRLHDVARTWLTERCAGFFAQTPAGQPVVDLNLFSRFDPTSSKSNKRELGEPLRALGMDGIHFYHYVSPQIEGAVFVPGEALKRGPIDALQNCWGVVGSYEVVSLRNDQPGYGKKPYSAGTLAAMFDDAIRSFLLYTAVVQYTSRVRETFSAARDTARKRHRNFKPRQIEQLRRELLATSLDLPVVARDLEEIWKPWWRAWNGIVVKGVPAPDVPNPPDEFDLIERFGEGASEAFKELIEEDAAYRDVLSTVSSLGASASETRLGRRALLVAGASLVVAMVTLLVTTGNPSLWERLLTWVTS